MALLKSFDKDVASSATPEPIALRTKGQELIIIPKSTNSGTVYIGDVDGQTFPIPSEGIKLDEFRVVYGGEPWDLEKIYLRVDTNGDGVHVLYGIRK